MQKKCTKCGEIKNLNLFQLDRAKKDGRKSRCKSCCSTAKPKPALTLGKKDPNGPNADDLRRGMIRRAIEDRRIERELIVTDLW